MHPCSSGIDSDMESNGSGFYSQSGHVYIVLEQSNSHTLLIYSTGQPLMPVKENMYMSPQGV